MAKAEKEKLQVDEELVESHRREVVRWAEVLDGMGRHFGAGSHPGLRLLLRARYEAALAALEQALTPG